MQVYTMVKIKTHPTRGFKIHLAIGLLIFIILPLSIFLLKTWFSKAADPDEAARNNTKFDGGIINFIKCNIIIILNKLSIGNVNPFIIQDKVIEILPGLGQEQTGLTTYNIKLGDNDAVKSLFICAATTKIPVNDVMARFITTDGIKKKSIETETTNTRQHTFDGDDEINVNPKSYKKYLEIINSNWKFNSNHPIAFFFEKIRAFFKSFILKTTMELKRPAGASPLKISTMNLIGLITFISLTVAYVRKLIINTNPKYSNYFPHWAYKYQERHPKTSGTIYTTLAIYFIIKGYFYLINTKKISLDKILEYTLLLIISITILIGLRYYVYSKFEGKYFTFKYNKYIKTKKTSSGEPNRHLVRETKKIYYTSLINYSLIAIPSLAIVGVLFNIFLKDSMKGVNTNIINFKYLIIITVIILIIVYRKRIHQYYLDNIKSLKNKTILFKGPQYLTDMDKLNQLPFSLGTYESINQKYTTRKLNKKQISKHEFAISLWLWIDNFKDNDTQFNTIFNYNNKPLIQLNSTELMIQFKNNNKNDEDVPEIQLTYLDKPKQQKWNNLIINFKNSTVEIYMNGNLVMIKKNLLLDNDYSEPMYIGEPKINIQCALKNIEYYPNVLSLGKIKEKQIIL